MRRLSLHTVIALLAVIALSTAGCGGDNPLNRGQVTPTPAATRAALPSAAPSVAGPLPTVAPPTAAPSPPVTPAGPSPQPTPAAEPTSTLPIARPTPSDARSAQIKTTLQGKGFQVLEVAFIPARDGKPSFLAAIVEADYAQPSGEVVLRQAFGVWDVLFHSLTIDSPEVAAMVLMVGERWTKYVMYLGVRVEDAASYLKSVQAAGSDEQKQEVLQTFLRAIQFSVFDVERQEFVDLKDFTNKNFTQ